MLLLFLCVLYAAEEDDHYGGFLFGFRRLMGKASAAFLVLALFCTSFRSFGFSRLTARESPTLFFVVVG